MWPWRSRKDLEMKLSDKHGTGPKNMNDIPWQSTMTFLGGLKSGVQSVASTIKRLISDVSLAESPPFLSGPPIGDFGSGGDDTVSISSPEDSCRGGAMRELPEVVSTSVALATSVDLGDTPEGRTSQLRRSSTWNPTLRVPPLLASCKVALSRL